ncbi:hypothetical protein BY996DRAFT_6462298 [Phakopsora pachyrhizi]|nr:hypothetical protein BY996DRAFT_6462298 [Phakopsora pachyrhizi]
MTEVRRKQMNNKNQVKFKRRTDRVQGSKDEEGNSNQDSMGLMRKAVEDSSFEITEQHWPRPNKVAGRVKRTNRETDGTDRSNGEDDEIVQLKGGYLLKQSDQILEARELGLNKNNQRKETESLYGSGIGRRDDWIGLVESHQSGGWSSLENHFEEQSQRIGPLGTESKAEQLELNRILHPREIKARMSAIRSGEMTTAIKGYNPRADKEVVATQCKQTSGKTKGQKILEKLKVRARFCWSVLDDEGMINGKSPSYSSTFDSQTEPIIQEEVPYSENNKNSYQDRIMTMDRLKGLAANKMMRWRYWPRLLVMWVSFGGGYVYGRRRCVLCAANKGFRGLRQDKDSTKIKGQKSRRYRIKRLRTIRKKSRAVEQDRKAENSGKESIGVKKSPTKARSFISLNNKSIIKE